ncbi:hypothetical protein SAMN04488557_1198 [Hyphomicrobium facile]|uniref:Uncharacterized protein n=2 Tax=Hyphomicrobium facile TaxID=51670 RepID=A0A1I7N3G4_9HYPH|nr:hypothetical protein SAMN04488557_1198 [Hyphomicrobium facile]
MTLALVALWPWPALSEPVSAAPDLDCSMGFEALRNWAAWVPGAEQVSGGNPNVVAVAQPDVWRVEITFTKQGDAAHPAVTLRKFVKQVTGVWTAQSKVCGYGDQAQFQALVAGAKAEDSRLTNLSRAEVEEQKKKLSPLGSP